MEKKDFTATRIAVPFLDLFAGAGGFSEGFLQARTAERYYDFRLATDINENCELTHRVRYNRMLGLDTAFLRQDIMEDTFLDNLLNQLQGQGQENKEYREAYLLTDALAISAQATLYRPKTKKGDPRMWFSRLSSHANADDIFALFHDGQTLYIINVTQTDIALRYDCPDNNPTKETLSISPRISR